jgi:predicted alpha-1,6-mannanase (GH76 family)
VSPPRLGRGRWLACVVAATAIAGSAVMQGGCGAVAHTPGVSAATPESAARAGAAAARLHRLYGANNHRARSWQSATALEAAVDYMRASGSRAYLSDLERTYLEFHHGGFLGRYYDDEGWWALAWIAAYQLTGDGRFLGQAKDIFADMTTGWDSTCGGGIWWSKGKTYKNAIPNELFLDIAARLHDLTPGDTAYLTWATREWTWFAASGMLTGSHLVIDGLAGCRAMLGSPTWTYNQGVLIGGLAELSDATRDTSLLGTARAIASAVISSSQLSPGGILREPCELSFCDQDAEMFKGIFVDNLKLLDDHSPDASYEDYMRRNAAAVWRSDRRGDDFGLHWAGPFDHTDLARQAAALDVLTTQVAQDA